ncbi:MAG: hypothetical protein ACOX4O_01030 [Eubacteriales bacterium]|jgi:ABC-type glycerol-3-phosphate transport system substrate-binding protein
MTKRIFSLIIAVLTMLSLITACSSGDGGKTPGTGESADNIAVTDTAETTEISYIDQFANLDYNGEEVQVIVLSIPGANPSISIEDNTGERIFDQLYQRDRDVEDLLNITISYTETADSVAGSMPLAEKFQKAVMAGDCPWYFMLNSIAHAIAKIASSGTLIDMSTLPYFSPQEPWWNRNVFENMSYNGRLFFDTGSISLAYFYSPCILAYNQNLAESYGVNDIYDRVIGGTWTIDYFNEIIDGTSADLDGDGVMKETDQFGLAVDDLSSQSFYIGIGGRNDMVNEDGIPILVVNKEENISRVQKTMDIVGVKERTLYTEGLPGEHYTEKKTRTFKAGRAFFLGYNMSGLIDQLRDMENDYGIIPLPKYDETQDRYYTYGSPFGPIGICVPITNSAEQNEITGAVIEAMAYLAYTEVQPLMYDITLKEKVARDERSKEMLDIIYEDIIYDWTQCLNPGDLNIVMRQLCTGAKQDPVSAIAKIYEKAEAALKKVMDTYEGLEG